MLVRRDPPSKVRQLPPQTASLDGPLPYDAPPRTLFALGSYGGMSVEPDAGFSLVFGRNYDEVHVCVGADDLHVSRQQGYIKYQDAQWVLQNTGTPAIRFPGQRIVCSGHAEVLPLGYTPLFVLGPRREHLLQVRVSGTRTSGLDPTVYEAKTYDPHAVDLDDRQLLVLACLGQRYLRREAHPQPMAWADVEMELRDLRPTEHWTWRKAAWIVKKLRHELSAKERIAGLLEKEVPRPVGNTLNHNLVTALMSSARLTPDHLRLLRETPPARRPENVS